MKNSKLLKSLLCLMLISVIGLLPITAVAAQNAYILNVSADNVRLRSGSGGSIITTLRKGSKVLYWGGKSGSFLKVATIDGKVGYVYRNYLSVYGAVNKNQVYITNKTAAVYKKSGSKLKRYTGVSAGRYLLVIGKNSNWAYVRTMTGKAGYIRTSDITKAF